MDPLPAVARGSNEQLRERKRREEHRRVVLAETAQLGISGHSDDLEETRLLAYSDFLADRIGIAEETVRQSFVENSRHGSAGAIRDLKISAAQDGDAENPTKLLAAAEFVGIARGGNWVATAAYKARLQFAHERQRSDRRDPGDARNLFDDLGYAIAPGPARFFAQSLPRRLVGLHDYGICDVEAGICVSEVEEAADE